MKIRLALIGSRNFTDYNIFTEFVASTLLKWNLSINDIEFVVSGGAAGADTLAEKWSLDNNIPIKVFKPDWKKFGKAAGPLRNTDIINEATHVIAFPTSTSIGTWDSIRKSQKKGIPTEW
jgi:hypothetical protein